MTPQRQAYLAKCSRKEFVIRKNIAEYKSEIKVIKKNLAKSDDVEFDLGLLHWRKFHLMLFKHELARLKGVDNVVVPKFRFAVNEIICRRYTGKKSYYGYCGCGKSVNSSDDKFCCKCGRKLLWEKVKI